MKIERSASKTLRGKGLVAWWPCPWLKNRTNPAHRQCGFANAIAAKKFWSGRKVCSTATRVRADAFEKKLYRTTSSKCWLIMTAQAKPLPNGPKHLIATQIRYIGKSLQRKVVSTNAKRTADRRQLLFAGNELAVYVCKSVQILPQMRSCCNG